jgi:Na+-translocating ferredoxin:NAD+ oxidoreductase RnfD subunit
MLGYAFLLISYPLPMTTWASEFVNFNIIRVVAKVITKVVTIV